MKAPIELSSDDPIIKRLKFVPYRNMVERRVERFLPGPGEPKRMEVATPWGESLTAKSGDYLVSEMDAPDDRWPVNGEIFEKSYEIIRPGSCVKRALTYLVPLTDITNGDAEQLVTIYTLEGPETVSAGEFYLARGIQGEIWPYPREKVDDVMMPVE
jgi:hypothetical protein